MRTLGQWRKSSRSSSAGGNCVETRAYGASAALVEIRDSKAPQLGSLAIDRAEFAALLDSVKLSTTVVAARRLPWLAATSPGAERPPCGPVVVGLASLDLVPCNGTAYAG